MDITELKHALSDPENLGGVIYGSVITGNTGLTRNQRCFMTSFFDDSENRDLTLNASDWQEGDWFVIRQFGDGQATIVPQNANVKLPDWDKTAGKGYDMYIECYSVSGSDKYFHIIGGAL